MHCDIVTYRQQHTCNTAIRENNFAERRSGRYTNQDVYDVLFSRPPGVAGVRLSVFAQYFFSIGLGPKFLDSGSQSAVS